MEGLWPQQPENPTEGIVARRSVLQGEKVTQQVLLGGAEIGHVDATFSTTEACQEGDEQDFLEVKTLRIAGPGILKRAKTFTKTFCRKTSSNESLETAGSNSSNTARIQMRSPWESSSGPLIE